MSTKEYKDKFSQEELNKIKTMTIKDDMNDSTFIEQKEQMNRSLKTLLEGNNFVSPLIELQKQIASFSYIIANSLSNTISALQPVMSSITNASNSIAKSMLSCINTINEVLKDFNFDEFHLRLISELLSEKQDNCEKFLEESIFTPIFYMGLENDLGNKNINEYLKQEDLKQYYSDRISDWHNGDIEGYPNELIDDIKFNYDNNRVYGVVTLIFVLLEYRVRNINGGKIIPKSSGEITKTTRGNLKENVFDPTDSQSLYDEFIDSKGNSDIYKNTSNNPNSITRHVLHGDKLELITYESMMSVVFLYDFINEVLSYKN